MMERTLRVGKTMIDVYVGRNLHILDRDQEGTMTITNAIDKQYLQNVVEWLGGVPYDKVYLYHTDGYISEWSAERGFKHVPHNSNELYYKFLETCQQRSLQFKYVH